MSLSVSRQRTFCKLACEDDFSLDSPILESVELRFHSAHAEVADRCLQEAMIAAEKRALKGSIEFRNRASLHSAATRLCTTRKYTATTTSTSPFTPNTIGAVNIGTSHPDSRFPIGIPPRKAKL